jgi:PAS domain S-box-containing protein
MERRNRTITNTPSHVRRVLRRRAEDRARELSHSGQTLPATEWDLLTPDAMQHIVHQLQVHQIELEMQNEALRDTQSQLEAARLRYFDLYDLAPVGYCSLSEQGVILEANLLAANLLGWDRSALVSQMLSHFILAADQDIYYLHRKQLFDAAQTQTCELRMLRADNTTFWAQLKTSVENDAQGLSVLRIVISDISERKLVETQKVLLDHALQDSNIRLEHATTAAEKSNLAKSDFLSNMSHEMRTPLNAILGFAQMLEAGTPALNAKQKGHVDQILQGGWYLLKLINEILDLALIESGKLSIHMEPVSILNVISDCHAMIEQQAEKRDIRLYVAEMETTHTHIDYFVQADPTRLKQVLINLLSNAIKYNKTGGTVAIKCIEKSAERMRICIEDSGEGLSPEKIALLFQPFNRLGQETGAEEGTGIGLVMTKRLIELMGGEIGVESTMHKGSLFWVELNMTP